MGYLVARATIAIASAAVLALVLAPRAQATIGACDTAGPVEVEATVDGPGPAAYATLSAAIAAINAGVHTGAINVELCASTTEAGAIVLNSAGAGAADYASISIRPLADGLTISGPTVTGRGLIELNGADNVTIDGDNPNTPGINRNLTITNTSANTVTFTSVVRLAISAAAVTSADGDTVRNCIIQGSATGRNIPSATSGATGSEASTYGIYAGGGASTDSDTAAPSAIASLTTTAGGGSTATSFTADNNQITACARGIAVQGSAATIFNLLSVTGNVIGDASSASTTTVYSRGMTLQGFDNATVSSNTIQNIASFTGAQVMGLSLGDVSPTGTRATIERNVINTVNARSLASFGAYGINLAAGAAITVRNNVVTGVTGDMTAGGTFTTTFGLFGIRVSRGTGHKIYHNTVQLSGARSGTAGSSMLAAAFGITLTGLGPMDVRNNIFANTLTGGTTSLAYVSTYLPAGGTRLNMNLTWNNNAYYTGATAGVHGVCHVGPTYAANPAGAPTYAGLYTGAHFVPGSSAGTTNLRFYTSTLSLPPNNDDASLASSLAAPFASSTDLHIATGVVPTPLESAGAGPGFAGVNGVTTDIDGDARPGPAGSVNGGGIAPDLGADEFDGARVAAGDIAATAFVDPANGGSNPANVAFSPRASFANAGTASQESVTVRYRILDAGSFEVYNDTQTIASLAPAASATVPFAGATLAAGTYTIKAKAELSGDAFSGNDEITGSLAVEAPLCGNYDVGSGGAFTSLTNAGGAFAALNRLGASCAVTFRIISDLTGETGANPINPIAGGFTLLIKPSGGTRSISGASTAGGLIGLNGADNVTIDGSLTELVASQDMTITNASTGAAAVIWIHSAGVSDGASNNTVRNLRIFGGGGQMTHACVLAGSSTFGGAADAPNDDNKIQNNTIARCQNGAFLSGGATTADSGWEVSGNALGSTVAADKLGFRGILLAGASNFSISGNTISGVSSSTGSSSTMTGIQLAANIATGTIQDNRISDIKQNNPTGWGSNGIFLGASTTASDVTVVNNFIWDVASQGFNGVDAVDNGYGIVVATGGGYRIYNNSVSLNTDQGTGAGSGNTAAINILEEVVTAGAVDLRGNIFANSQTSGTRYGILVSSALEAISTIDYNDYFAQEVGFIDGAARSSLPLWQGATLQDAHSFAVDPQFVSGSNLHLSLAGGASPIENAGLFLAAVSDDIDGGLRDAAHPDIGADEQRCHAAVLAEAIDDGNSCTVDTCDPMTGARSYTAVGAGGTCRPAAGPCDVPETCDGTFAACPADAFQLGTVCRGAASACDISESCDGSGASCPADVVVGASTSCTGSSQGGVCDDDAADHCDGANSNCIDAYQSAGLGCRASAGPCDVAETCTGASGACPVDGFAAASTSCTGGSHGGVCDDDAGDHCAGSSNACIDAYQPSTVICHGSAGPCDAAEICTGSSGSCPADAYEPAGFACRASAGPCDFAETCTGALAECPADVFAPASTSCIGSSQGGGCDDDAADHCSGVGHDCLDAYRSAGFACRAAAGPCDVAEVCIGSAGSCPADVFAPSETSCTGGSQGGACDDDAAEHCSGAGSACLDVFRSAGFACRASAGPCDVAETCSGTLGSCPSDVFASSATSCTGSSQGGACDDDAADHCDGSSNACADAYRAGTVTCRGSSGPCDVAETCTGSAGSCPADAVQPADLECRASAGPCDVAESCTGSSGSCPADAFASAVTSCTGGSQGGSCDHDTADHCSGSSNTCLDAYQLAGFECRTAAGPCDVAESCTGASGSCPLDVFASSATSCTGSSQGGSCDHDTADHCSGAGNTCLDAYQSAGFECRASTGQCDVAETCIGSSGSCPADVFASSSTSCTGGSQGGGCDSDAADHCSGAGNACLDAYQSAGFECRASAGQCDAAESCTGSSGGCPADAYASSSTLCTGALNGGSCDNDAADHCNGSNNTCLDAYQSAGFECRGSAGQCDVAESCTGSSGSCPADAFASSATSCTGGSQGGACDHDTADHCSGAGNTCLDAYHSAGFECRPSAGQCDVAETCAGSSGSCPADVFVSSATSCTGGSQGGSCDHDTADHCSGSSNTCLDAYQSAGFECRGSTGQCDVAESCTGSSGPCPVDAFASSAASCTGGSQGGSCDHDAADHCSGSSNGCVDAYQSAGFQCRASAGQCDVTETCTGSSGSCPADVFASSATICTGGSQGGSCDRDTADHCSGAGNTCLDAYQSAGFECRASTGQCDVPESCTGSSGSCPADAFASSVTSCTGGSQGGGCDHDTSDHCSGSSNACLDAYQLAGFACRTSAGPCDVAEACTGSSGSCPADAFASSVTSCTGGSQGGACDHDAADHCSGSSNTCLDAYQLAGFACRTSAGPCDVAEACTGSSGSCPADVFASSATSCTGGSQGGSCDHDTADHCSGAGNTCLDAYQSAGFECRASTGQCDVPESCTGSSGSCPADAFASSVTSCTGSSQGGSCDHDTADHCSGAGNTCLDAYQSAGFECRASTGQCDLAESCTGSSGSCPADVFASSATICTGGSQGGSCDRDTADHCSGAGNTCLDAYQSAGFECRASTGQCDLAESCTGSSGSCPLDVFASSVTSCTGGSQGGGCDHDTADHCSGSSNTCLDAYQSAGFECRGSTGQCDVAESCTGLSGPCPADVFASSATICTGGSQGGSCDRDTADHCSGAGNTCLDAYQSAGFECRASTGQCDLAESCTGSSGSCPADAFASSVTSCTGGSQGGGCDHDTADHCSGSGNACLDAYQSAGFECRPSAGQCDVSESCTGSSGSCPADVFALSATSCTGSSQGGSCDHDTADHCSGAGNTCLDAYQSAGFECRPSAGQCDVPESCTGSSGSCPADVFASSATSCTGSSQGGSCDHDTADHCGGSSNTCVDAYQSVGFECRSSVGQCDVAESCTGSSGSCPADVFASSTTSCTGGSQGGACDHDAADHCGGSSNTCVDAYQSVGFECRSSVGQCDVAEACTGSSGSCPADVFALSATSCTGSSQGGSCDHDAADHCSGSGNACLDAYQSAGFECRSSVRQCDVAESCTGSSGSCPADSFAVASTSCTGSSQGGSCDHDTADHCSGAGNTCLDAYQSAGFECRASTGQCDLAESCTGSSGSCPLDVFASSVTSCTGGSQGGGCDHDAADHCSGSGNACLDAYQLAGFECRPSAGQCDVAESCTGSSGSCPADAFASSVTSCTGGSQGGACDHDAADHCSGSSNTCLDAYQSAGFECRPSAGQCDVPESCTGSSGSCPADSFAVASTSCTGSSQGGSCDHDAADHCSGSGNTCLDAYQSAGFECRSSVGQCDVAEACTGSSDSCPADGFAAASTSCTGSSQGGLCDHDTADHCSGSGNACLDAFQSMGFECRAAAGQCDVAESCTGSSGSCPADGFAVASTSCTGSSQGGSCDHDTADHCSGAGNTCLDAYQSAGIECRGSTGQCDIAESCTGSSGSCPADGFAVASTSCTGSSQGGSCDHDTADHCSGAGNTCLDAYQSAGIECRGSTGQCDIAESCTGSSGSCPADGFAVASTSCTGSSQGGSCDHDTADHCSGSGTACLDAFQSMGFECRAAAGPCDVAESCTGSSGSCPADVFASSTTSCTGGSQGGACDNDAADHCSGAGDVCLDAYQLVGFECRPTAGQCDVAETCTGTSGSCPGDVFGSSTTSCTGGSQDGLCDHDAADHCSGSGTACLDAYQSAGFECRPTAGQCDVAESCTGSSGSCPEDLFASSVTSCTGGSQGGLCDHDTADHCGGSSNICVDAYQSVGFECRTSAGPCDVAETCTGTSGSCPGDVFASSATSCTGSSQGGACDNDAADHCSGSGTACLDTYQSVGFECRSSVGQCDVAEACTGSSASCPADVFASSVTSCTGGSQGGACDHDAADHCSGAGDACLDAYQSAGFECRPTAGQCDVAESCTGSSGSCPADVFASSATSCTGSSQGGACDHDAADHCGGSSNTCVDAYQSVGFECRSSVGQCDVAEACTGSSASCPADVFASSVTSCTGGSQGGACDHDAADHCSGAGDACLDAYQSAGFECRPAAGQCDVAESCTGSSGSCPADVFASSATSCTGSSQGGACDHDAADHCGGSSNTCVDAYQSVGFECRSSVGQCDVAEACTGSSASCPADVFASSVTSCTGGSQGGACDHDAADHCSGAGDACLDAYQSAGFECRPAAGQCDVAESCTGSSGSCPADVFASSATSCTGSSQGGACDHDAADHCGGSSNTCVDAYQSVGFECRSPVGQCDVAEACTGSSGSCPADGFAVASTSCTGSSQGGLCDQDTADHCSGAGDACLDAYQSAGFECRPSAGQCDVAESCTGSSGSCPADGFAVAPTSCTGGSQGGVCDHDAADHCDGSSNTCVDAYQSAGYECRDSAGPCDVAETCTGTSSACPADAFASSATSCTGGSQGGACDDDAADHCDGSSNACVDTYQSAGFECRASVGPCDPAEVCTGSSAACPDDLLADSSTVCREGVGTCDLAESCTGSSPACPADAIVSVGVECRESGDICDVAESCDGLLGTCPADEFQPSSFECRPSTESCDPAEYCTGSSASCPADATNQSAPVGSTVTESQSGSATTITWTESLAGPFNVYRGSIRGGAAFVYNHSCYATGVPGPSLTDTTIPPPGLLWYYLISRQQTSCNESNLSQDGSEGDRPNPYACGSSTGFPDRDVDGTPDAIDNCPAASNPSQADTDLDMYGDACDNCFNTPNVDQTNADGDELGDACDPDVDNDGYPNASDNCPYAANDQTNADGDGSGDACDE